MGGGENQAYSRLSTTHGHITDCKLDSVVYAGVRRYGIAAWVRQFEVLRVLEHGIKQLYCIVTLNFNVS